MAKGKKISFPSPSSSQKKTKNDIIQSFSQFWNNSKFTIAEKNRAELSESIEDCAEKTSMIKEYLDVHNRGPVKIYQGNGREVLWNLEELPKDKAGFVNSLIHALFSDGSNYTSKLTKDELDRLIQEADEFLLKRNSSQLETIKSLENDVKQNWEITSKLLEEIFKKIDENPLASPVYSNNLHKLSNSMQSLQQLVKKFHRVTNEIKEKPEDSPDNSDAEIVSNEPKHEPSTQELSEEQQKGKIVVKQIADDVVNISEELKSLSEKISILKKDEIVTNPQESMRVIDTIHRSCIGYSESLMKDLLKLDELSLSQEDRPKRKEQVMRIQQLTSDLDSFNERIHELIKEIKVEEKRKEEDLLKERERSEMKKKEEEERKELERKELEKKELERREQEREEYLNQLALKRKHREEEMEKERVMRELELQKQSEEFERRLTEQAKRLWPYFKKLKLKAHFEVEQEPTAYVLSCHIPGMKNEDIEISASKQGSTNVLSIKGFRGPTLEEMSIMRRQLARMDLEDDDESLLRICLGRFGTFSERYSLPFDADAQNVSADYKSGVLTIVVPRIKRNLTRVPSMYDNPEFWW